MRVASRCLLAVAFAACSPAGMRLPAPIPPLRGEAQVAFSLRYFDVASRVGVPARTAACLYVHYTGWRSDGTQFDSSHDTTAAGAPRPPISFPQGYRRVIAGWDAGFEGMRVGARRRLIIPYQLAYGERGRPPLIPPRATLIFDTELMAVADTLPRNDTTAVRAPAAAPPCPPWTAVRAGQSR